MLFYFPGLSSTVWRLPAAHPRQLQEAPSRLTQGPEVNAHALELL